MNECVQKRAMVKGLSTLILMNKSKEKNTKILA